MKIFLKLFLILMMTFKMGNCLDTIFPEEFSSFMNLILSTIPMIKKVTESRFGFGFRNGPNSDLQVVFELGPQKYTQPLEGGDNNSIDNDNTFKREVSLKDAPKIKSSSPSHLQQQKQQQQLQSKTKQKLSNRLKKPIKFISPKVIQQKQQQQQQSREPKRLFKKSTFLDEDSFKQLQSLYKFSN